MHRVNRHNKHGNGDHDTDSKELTAAGIARLFGVSFGTVNYYTSLGLLKEHRREGNKRYYDRKEACDRLEKVRVFRSRGYNLRAIRGILTEHSSDAA